MAEIKKEEVKKSIVVTGLTKKYYPSLTAMKVLLFPIKLTWKLIGLLIGSKVEIKPEVRNVNFDIPEGVVVGFLGPNGAGKTTTMKLLTNLLRPDAGKIEIFGLDVKTNYSTCLESVGCAVGDPAFYGYLSGYENLKILSFFHKGVTEAWINKLLKMVGLAEAGTKKFREYSSGMKKRLALASTMVQKPSILILDEPTSGMDPRGRIEFRGMIKDINKNQGVTIFISSHELKELEDICDYLVIIEDGKIKLSEEISSIRKKIGKKDAHAEVVVYTPFSEKTENLLKEQDYIIEVEVKEKFYLLKMKKNRVSILPTLFVESNIELNGFYEEQNSIEDIYLKTTNVK